VPGQQTARPGAAARILDASTGSGAQSFDPSAPPLTPSDAEWAIETAKKALSGVKELLAASPPERFS
jgi:hypothetical protein